MIRFENIYYIAISCYILVPASKLRQLMNMANFLLIILITLVVFHGYVSSPAGIKHLCVEAPNESAQQLVLQCSEEEPKRSHKHRRRLKGKCAKTAVLVFSIPCGPQASEAQYILVPSQPQLPHRSKKKLGWTSIDLSVQPILRFVAFSKMSRFPTVPTVLSFLGVPEDASQICFPLNTSRFSIFPHLWRRCYIIPQNQQ